MIKLTKAQRDQLIGIGVGTVALMGCLWWFGVQAEQKQLAVTRVNTANMKAKLKSGADEIAKADKTFQDLTNRLEVLDRRENGLANAHDPYTWIISTILNPFILKSDGVHITFCSQPEISEKGILTHFPYKWVTFHVRFRGHYYDMGKFIAGFETTFPYFSVQNIEISSGGQGMEPDELTYAFDIVTPLGPANQETK